jgi:hypothetical protein
MNIKREVCLVLIGYNLIALCFLFFKVFFEGTNSILSGIIGGVAVVAPILTISALARAFARGPRSDAA